MPASESLLSIFITTHGAGRVGKGTLLSWLSGLQLWHVINGTPWNGGAHLSRAVKGVASFAPSSSFRAPRLPVTIHHLRVLKQDLDITNTFDAAVWAIACIAFWSQCRLAEVCIDLVFDPKVHTSRSSPLKSGFAANGVEFGGFFAPLTKTKPCGEWICWTDSGCECSALTAFQNHRHLNQNLPLSAPLFAFETADDERGAQREDVQVYILALRSPLPALTIPPHQLTMQPANHCRNPHVLDPTHTFSPATHASPGAMMGCCHPVYAAATATIYSPAHVLAPSHMSPAPVHASLPLMVHAAHPLRAAHPR